MTRIIPYIIDTVHKGILSGAPQANFPRFYAPNTSEDIVFWWISNDFAPEIAKKFRLRRADFFNQDFLKRSVCTNYLCTNYVLEYRCTQGGIVADHKCEWPRPYAKIQYNVMTMLWPQRTGPSPLSFEKYISGFTQQFPLSTSKGAKQEVFVARNKNQNL